MPSDTLPRRRLLAALGSFGAVSAAGCSALSPADDRTARLTLDVHERDGSLRGDRVHDLADSSVPGVEDAFRTTVEGGTYRSQYRRPFPMVGEDDPAYARHEGTYYRLGSVVVDEVTVSHPVLRLYEVGSPEELDDVPEHTAHESLPQVDRIAVEIAHKAARARGDVGGVPWGLVQRGGFVYRRESAAERSTLVGASDAHVEYRDRIYRVETTTEEFHEAVYRATVTPVTDSPAQLEEILRAELLDARLAPDALSAAELDLFRRARAETVVQTHPFSPPLRSLLRKLGHRAYVDGNVSKDAGVDRQFRRLLLYGDRYFDYYLELSEPDD
ncbi:hypothetical protein [Haloarcula litorea]|uniref:hypothetical protein n=1 Tax=Haloarcula litorea TaxID=3032579 RepID=UPI0023E87750|nr:hypothetical protein [Halomicroarcula sp. GDY20]